MDEWIAQHSTADEREVTSPAGTRKRPAAKKAATKRTKPSTRTTKKAAPPSPAKTAKTAKTAKSTPRPEAVAPDRGAIGSNPERRFGSGPSRGLAPKR